MPLVAGAAFVRAGGILARIDRTDRHAAGVRHDLEVHVVRVAAPATAIRGHFDLWSGSRLRRHVAVHALDFDRMAGRHHAVPRERLGVPREAGQIDDAASGARDVLRADPERQDRRGDGDRADEAMASHLSLP
jgi:hypothetical protein